MKFFSALAAKATSISSQVRRFPLAAFTFTELLVVIAILAILAVTQLAAVSGSKSTVRDFRCMSNIRQIGAATLLYKDDHNDEFPFGIYTTDLNNPNVWPRMILTYLGGYGTNVQPGVYLCPNEKDTTTTLPFTLHYMGNRQILSDVYESQRNGRAVRGSEVRRPSIYALMMEKGVGGLVTIRAGSMGNPVRLLWNVAPGFPEHRRHTGAMTTAAADGHAEWLHMPPYQPGLAAPLNMLELGDCSTGNNPGSTWEDPTIPGDENGGRAKLWFRRSQGNNGEPVF